MQALILNGAADLRDMAAAMETALESHLHAQGYAVAKYDLAELKIPYCKGDFGCWTATPGLCVQRGPHCDIGRDLVQSDVAVWLTPITFGGYSSALKRALDHCIPLVSPFFTTLDGETHHRPRYEKFPSVLAIGLLDKMDMAAATVFHRLVRRNALNMHARHFAGAVLCRYELPQAAEFAAGWLELLPLTQSPVVHASPLELGALAELPRTAPRRILILNGSPRGRDSVSATLGGYLSELLAARGVDVESLRLHGRAQGDPGLRDLAARVDRADVVVLATPLYVDSLPAPVTEALELLARQRAGAAASRPRLMAIVNCGFPESVHNDTALAICRLFAHQARLDWMGGLGIGAGGMLAAGRSLAEQGGRARNVTRALAMAANAILEGRFLPEEARHLAGKLAIPAWAYRFMGDWGFRRDARKHGVLGRVDARPYVS